MSTDSSCYLSVVVTTRNDDAGGNMLRRLQLFLEFWLFQSERHRLNMEVVLVEWNPPAGPRLREVLKLRYQSRHAMVRFVEVSPEIHASFSYHDVLPLFQMIAKNVGIRRASGQYILATNQDILLSEATVSFIASMRLETGFLYRTDRIDCDANVPTHATVSEQLDWCEAHGIRAHTRDGSVPYSTFLASKGAHRDQDADVEKSVHTEACGDFTLCHRDHWFAARGYHELPVHSLHLDSLFCYTAIALDLRERYLGSPFCCYHLEHGRTWAATNTEERVQLFLRVPWLDGALVQQVRRQALIQKYPVILNDENWGLADLHLPEVAI